MPSRWSKTKFDSPRASQQRREYGFKREHEEAQLAAWDMFRFMVSTSVVPQGRYGSFTFGGGLSPKNGLVHFVVGENSVDRPDVLSYHPKAGREWVANEATYMEVGGRKYFPVEDTFVGVVPLPNLYSKKFGTAIPAVQNVRAAGSRYHEPWRKIFVQLPGSSDWEYLDMALVQDEQIVWSSDQAHVMARAWAGLGPPPPRLAPEPINNAAGTLAEQQQPPFVGAQACAWPAPNSAPMPPSFDGSPVFLPASAEEAIW
ncbi:hypothetical protein ACN47E_008351 [Coniothyrium glycines]